MSDYIGEIEEEECEDCDLYHNPEAGDLNCHPETGDTVCCLPDEEDNLPSSEGKINLNKEKKSDEVKQTTSVGDLERKVYKLEAALSVAAGTINWTNRTEAKRIMQSLIALLTDQIGELE